MKILSWLRLPLKRLKNSVQ